jgi:hypothetical protein
MNSCGGMICVVGMDVNTATSAVIVITQPATDAFQ